MKILFNWLTDYIKITKSPGEVAQLLTQSGLEVASITNFEPVRGNFKGLIIGQVTACEKHPNADQLKVTLVDIGQGAPLRIVCGAPNIQVGQKVVVATVGAQLHSHENTVQKIKKAKIRGELSEGMICAEDEIGLEHTHEGILVLNTSLAPGTPAAQYFDAQPDQILDIDLTPNRADACSHLGIAREISALLDCPIQYPDVEKLKATEKTLPICVEVLDYSACPRYSGIAIRQINIKQSPLWLRNKLRAIGLSPINNVVDVTNFVLHELGQPIYAFDYDQIVGKLIVVKKLNPGTSFVMLDNTTRQLFGEELMICDQLGSMSMAGIVGGKRASIHPDTQNIFLESAYFAPDIIRKSAKKHAITTDSSFRYERGTDPNLTVYALKRACFLLQEIAQGEIASTLIDLYPEKIEHYSVTVYYKNITQLLGIDISKAVIKKILSGLGIAMIHEESNSFIASVPPYRVDVKREVDIIEEIARIYGYDRIQITGKLGSTYLARTTKPEQHKLQHGVADLLVANGYHEIYTNSFTKSSYAALTDALDEQQHVSVLNPVSESLNVLRQTLLFTGLETVANNINRKQADLKLFEFGKIYHKEGQKYVENNRLGIWLTGNIEAVNWIRKPQEVTFQDMNAILHKVLHQLNFTDFVVQPYQNSFYQEGIQVVLDQTQLLTAGPVYQPLLRHMDIKQPIFFADIDWGVLLRKWKPLGSYQAISKFPTVKRDISLVLKKSVNFEAVKKVITQQKNKLIKDVKVFDVYQGDKLEQGKKAYALRFVLQGQNTTLDEKTIEHTMTRITRAFEDQLGAVIREGDAQRQT
ncbi:MAG: phenylalanine--tRNA ligase subunit beta [Amoebophilaceae bacterium]|jgi:phenylalanyl-tRNA synthetase beta chain|nr:phenylalanine--tRNA ligase subunit beta [Amoebophilaceae bacterium]